MLSTEQMDELINKVDSLHKDFSEFKEEMNYKIKSLAESINKISITTELTLNKIKL